MASPPGVKYLPRALVYVAVIILQLPFHWLELIFFKRKIETHDLNHDPIIILGYWRSGTTYLQRLLCVNPIIGFLTQYEAFFPLGSGIHSMLFKRILNMVSGILKLKHPTHGVNLDMDFPSEEDIALCAASYPHTPMWSQIYTGRANYFMEKYLITRKGSPESKAFIRMYGYLVRKLSYFKKGKRLVLKSPANTSKIPEILEAFPNAKFIYIKRDCKEVYFSNVKLLSNNRHQWLRDMNKNQMTEYFISNYPRVIRHYIKTRSLIPAGNLFELDFIELCENPKKILQDIHLKFRINTTKETGRMVDTFLENNHMKKVDNYPDDLPQNVQKMFNQFYNIEV